MSYTTTHLTTLAHLKSLAQKVSENAGDANVIETVKVNGTSLAVSDKAVDITVPTNVSDLANDSGYQTAAEVAAAVSESGHASFKTVETLPSASDAESNVLYLFKNEDTGYYDIYALVGGEVVLLDDTSVDLSNYVTSDALADYVASSSLAATLASYVQSSEVASDAEVTEMLAEVYGA